MLRGGALLGRAGKAKAKARQERKEKEGKAWRRGVGGTCHPFSKFFNRRRAIVLRFFIGQVDKVHGIM